MILGEICTRSCGFCNVTSGKPKEVDADEPERIAIAVQRLGLRYVVLTSVSRDDLADGGAEHFCNCINSLRSIENPPAIEVLPSDFAGNMDAVDKLSDAMPNVYNYNVETVPRLFRQVRGAIPTIERTLAIFERIKKRHPKILLKSGMMLGLGETDDEVKETLQMLHGAGCNAITIGQYLQPNKNKLPVSRYVEPEQFDAIAETAKQIGFKNIAAAPFVRSSYRAEMMCGIESYI
jgi:lipoic acid synthetase